MWITSGERRKLRVSIILGVGDVARRNLKR